MARDELTKYAWSAAITNVEQNYLLTAAFAGDRSKCTKKVKADVPKTPKERFLDDVRDAAEGDFRAECLLSNWHLHGDNSIIETSLPVARKFLSNTVDMCPFSAECMLAFFYLTKRGGRDDQQHRKDETIAFRIFEADSERGDVQSRLCLASLYSGGKGVEQSAEMAMQLLSTLTLQERKAGVKAMLILDGLLEQVEDTHARENMAESRAWAAELQKCIFRTVPNRLLTPINGILVV